MPEPGFWRNLGGRVTDALLPGHNYDRQTGQFSNIGRGLVGAAGTIGAGYLGGPGAVRGAKALANRWVDRGDSPGMRNYWNAQDNNSLGLNLTSPNSLTGGSGYQSPDYSSLLQAPNLNVNTGGGGDTYTPQFTSGGLSTPQYGGGTNTGIIPPNFNVQTGTAGGGNDQFGIDTYGLNQGPGLQQQNFPLNPMDTTINTGSSNPPPAGGGNGGGDASQSAFGGRAGAGGGAFGNAGGGNTNFRGGGGGTLGGGSVVDPSQWGAFGLGGDSGPQSGGFGPGYQLQMMSGGMHEGGGAGPAGSTGTAALAGALRKPGLGPMGRPLNSGAGTLGKVGTGGGGPIMPGQPGVGNTGIVPPNIATGGGGQIQSKVGALRRPPIKPPPLGGVIA